MEVNKGDVVLCEFYFSDLQTFKKRPVLVLKDNLPYNDFVGIPISSKIENLKSDELYIDNDCFEVGSIIKKSKVMIRKTFVISKDVIVKKYAELNSDSFEYYHKSFCKYFEC